MFNKTVHNHDRYVSQTTSITEKRAPTDESIKLLKEMEAHAFDKLLGNFEVKNNVISGNVIFFKNVFDLSTQYVIKFKLNNQELSVDGVMQDYEHIVNNRDEIIRLFLNETSRLIASVLLEANAFEVSKNLLER